MTLKADSYLNCTVVQKREKKRETGKLSWINQMCSKHREFGHLFGIPCCEFSEGHEMYHACILAFLTFSKGYLLIVEATIPLRDLPFPYLQSHILKGPRTKKAGALIAGGRQVASRWQLPL